MASSILRWISRKAAARSPALPPNSLNSCGGCGGRSAATWQRRRMGTMSVVSDESVLCPSTLPSRISPWLMLPPAVEGTENNMVYKFYSLAEDKIISLNKRRGGEEEAANIELGPGDESELKGSSHGWLALFNPRNCDLFLSNPLSRRHIKLPPIHSLSIPKNNLAGGYGCVTNLIISCSPDEEECRAMMTFGPDDRLAFCCPGSSTEYFQKSRSAATWRRRIGTMSGVSDESVLCPLTLPSRISPWLMLPPAVEGTENNMLPPIHTLSIPEVNLKGGYGCVKDLIISCSPDEEECRAMMTFGTENRLAFSCPGCSTEWTHIGELYDSEEDHDVARCYESFVYSSTHRLFFCVTQFAEFEAWDLQDPSSPRLTTMDMSCEDDDYPWAARSEEELNLKKMCRRLTFLVVDSSSGQLYHVTRHVMEHMAPDGSYVDFFDEGSDKCPYKTIGFDVHKIDSENNVLSDFPELKPNSIYFIDVNVLIPQGIHYPNPTFGGHDIGIFNYEDGIFSPCYYPCDVKSFWRIFPPPTWFTPSPL
ncbi:hypothetical protein BUALT_Bualt04G0162900 [Buddleja alternifolia]|uniref:KIB1-4 beta-propeller domain-containing protein n=1 Tax=Buddleja alternifolia TaxID=168488 RepID=A0AAV6XPF0_9LAMI|nr:hypothetical protein BUALT_Bualt04G0162900 [Buddleja alternifolia]